jgi:hypothetical protein
MSNAAVGGLMRDLIFSMVGNVENRSALLEKCPVLRLTLNDRAFSTDDCENEFSIITLRCGFKPSWEIVAGLLKNIDELQAMKRNPEIGLVFFQSHRKRYSHFTHCAKLDQTWFSGVLDDKEGDAYKHLLADVHRRSWIVVKSSKAIRKYHKQGEHAH